MADIKKETTENYLQLAREAFHQEDYDTATDHLISVFQQDKNNFDALGVMGDIALIKSDFAMAESYYLRQLGISPQSCEAHINIGRLYMKRTEFDNAIHEFETAIQLDSEHIQDDPYINLSAVNYYLGNNEESYDWLNRLFSEVKKPLSGSHSQLVNMLYQNLAFTIRDNLHVSDLDGLIQQIETKYKVSIITHAVVNPDTPLMPFRITGECSYEIDYDLDSVDKCYEILTSLVLLDNFIGGKQFDFLHFLTVKDNGREQFATMTRNTMDSDSPLSMLDLLNYMSLDIQSTLTHLYTDEIIFFYARF